jgi:DNA repair exonuclease SbcCD ATPase subunit
MKQSDLDTQLNDNSALLLGTNDNVTFCGDKISSFQKQKTVIIEQHQVIDSFVRSAVNSQTIIERNINANNIALNNLSSELRKASEVAEVSKVRAIMLTQQISDLNFELNDIIQSLQSIEEQKDKLATGIIVIKKFNSDLTSNYIDVIENLTNQYLHIIDSDFQISLKGFATTKAGKVRDKIDVVVIKSNEYYGNYNKLSSGEKVRVDICCILAQNHLVNQSCISGGLDLLILDEIIESVDEVGVVNLVKVLENTKKTICIITHADHGKLFNNSVTVIKKDSVAYLQQN